MAMHEDYKQLRKRNIGRIKTFVYDGNPKQNQFMNQIKCEMIDARRD